MQSFPHKSLQRLNSTERYPHGGARPTGLDSELRAVYRPSVSAERWKLENGFPKGFIGFCKGFGVVGFRDVR